ncbi:MAG: DNA-protecting protein DprA [Deltaproteobacteria bacterium]|nr:DNA-protecting protein DprA [Deltaproteobacteria bacterium]
MKSRCDCFFLHDEAYPKFLKEIHDPPPKLWFRGDRRALDATCVAIVGARKATDVGKRVAFDIAAGLAKAGVTVVSGMAFGIDAAAHLGALDAGGFTIAVLGSGVDVPTPERNRFLAERIERQGLIISEFSLGTGAYASHFPQRNRIISGLSLGVVVVEAGVKSGSLITARLALEQGRDVFAVPGEAGRVQTAGSNGLLKQGAIPVETAGDVIAHLDFFIPPAKGSPSLASSATIFSLEEFAAKMGQAPREAASMLTQLVLEGKVVEVVGHRYQLRG